MNTGSTTVFGREPDYPAEIHAEPGTLQPKLCPLSSPRLATRISYSYPRPMTVNSELLHGVSLVPVLYH